LVLKIYLKLGSNLTPKQKAPADQIGAFILTFLNPFNGAFFVLGNVVLERLKKGFLFKTSLRLKEVVWQKGIIGLTFLPKLHGRNLRPQGAVFQVFENLAGRVLKELNQEIIFYAI
jgi:hypothetical protein